jgi:hypothetical protein
MTQPSTHNYSELEMNALIPKQQPPPPKPRAREFPITSVRFNQVGADSANLRVDGKFCGKKFLSQNNIQNFIKTFKTKIYLTYNCCIK